MRGDHHLLALTTTIDELTGDVKPLFAFPVQVCSAVENKDVRFEIAAPSGQKREQVYKDPATGDVVADDECQRGVFVGDQFRPIDPEQIADVSERTKIKTMVALGTLDLAEAWDLYGSRVTGRYFLQVPSKGGSAKAYRLTYEALLPERGARGKVITPARAIVTKRTAKSRQKLAFIFADEREGALVMVECAFATSVRSADDQVKAHLAAEVPTEQIAMARKVIGSLGDGHAAMQAEVDEAVALKQELVDSVLEGVEYKPPRAIRETVEEDSMEAMLEASLAAAA